MGDSVESFGEVQHNSVGLDVLVKRFAEVMECNVQLGLTGKARKPRFKLLRILWWLRWDMRWEK